MDIKVAFVSLGCPKNQIDTEVMLAKLNDGGFIFVEEDINADVVIINTCAFIKSAKEEAIENILDVAWLKKNRSLKGIVVTGCLAERYTHDIEKDLPEVDVILGIADEKDICEAVKAAYEGKRFTRVSGADNQCLGGDRVLTTPEYTAYLKIAEGCDNRCTYCAIPDIRGHFRSRPIEDILNEAKTLFELGVKELVLVAQDTTRYGEDLYGKYSLDKLLVALCESKDFKFEWIRLLYCYPDKITPELVATIKKYDCIVKYLDIPLQHISDKVLKSMNRRGDSAKIKSVISMLRKEIPEIVLRTTFIVGFPGEGKKDFEELCEFIKETRFERLGVFAYSREENTPAYSFSQQIPEKEKEFRLDNIMNEQYTIQEDYNRGRIGKVLFVLCEGFDAVSESYFGRSASDAPEIDGRIFFSSKKRPVPGDIIQVEIDDVIDYDLVGKQV